MKKLFIAFSLMILCSVFMYARISSRDVTPIMPESRCTVPKTAIRDREFDCLKGNVHTVKSEFAVFIKKNGQFVKTAVSATNIVTYDKQGNKIETLNYGSKDYGTESSINRTVYNFNSKGFATGVIGYNNTYSTPSKNIYTLDDQGKIIKQTAFGNDGNVLAIVSLIYDSKGHNIEKRYDYISSIYKRYKEVYEYDGDNLIQTTHYNKDGSISYKGVFTYENGNRIETISYTQDAKGELIRSGRLSFKYDEKGNMIEKIIYNQDDSIKERYANSYDEKGFRISRIIYDSTGKIKSKGSLTYEFDSQGNWLSYKSDDLNSSEKINAGEPFPLELRTITYY